MVELPRQDSWLRSHLWHAMENSHEDDDYQELALMCGRMYPKESDEVEKYVDGLSDMIQGSVMASKPKTMQEAIEIVNDLINQKRYNVAQAYAAGTVERKEYARTLLLYNKCKFHHNGPYIAKRRETNQDHDNIEDDINA
nr:hypothetical protein [Tanacetum cinerariifolium]